MRGKKGNENCRFEISDGGIGEEAGKVGSADSGGFSVTNCNTGDESGRIPRLWQMKRRESRL